MNNHVVKALRCRAPGRDTEHEEVSYTVSDNGSEVLLDLVSLGIGIQVTHLAPDEALVLALQLLEVAIKLNATGKRR